MNFQFNDLKLLFNSALQMFVIPLIYTHHLELTNSHKSVKRSTQQMHRGRLRMITMMCLSECVIASAFN